MKTLEKYFKEEEILTKGLIVESILINRLEVCGYISSRIPYCIVNKAPHSQTVTSGYLCQTMVSLTGSTTEQVKRITVPIFHSLSFCKEAFEIELSKFYIPSLADNTAYCQIMKGEHRQSVYAIECFKILRFHLRNVTVNSLHKYRKAPSFARIRMAA